MLSFVVLRDDLVQLAGVVFHPVTLVNNHQLPLEFGHQWPFSDDILVCGDQNVEILRLQHMDHIPPCFGSSMKGHNFYGRSPVLEFPDPV